MFVYAFSFFMVLWNSGKNFMDKILHCFTYNVPKKKIYIKFCSFDYSILSANPLRKISTGTATPSLKFYLLYEDAKYQRSFSHFQP